MHAVVQTDAVPLYEQVRRQLLAEIDSGHMAEGSFLPSEADLCARFNVSRITLRRAVGELCAEGRLIRQQGRGTLVAQTRIAQVIAMQGFSDVIENMGRKPGHRVLACHDNVPIAALPDAADPVQFNRLLVVDDQPITLESLWFDAKRFPQVARDVSAAKSFFAALRRFHDLTPAGAHRRIDVGFATPDEAAHLHATTVQPVYRIDKTVLDTAQQPLAFSRLVTPCHLVTLTMNS